MKKLLLVCFLGLLFLPALSQITVPQRLQTLLQGKQNFYNIRKTVEDYYGSELSRVPGTDTKQLKKIMRDRKHWNRWFWYMEGRLDVNDNIVNVAEKTNDAITLQRQNRANLTEAVSGDWIEVGPTAVNFGVANQRGIGRVDRIVFHPTDGNTIFACTPAGGIWKTTNGGTSWSPVSAFLPSLGVSGFVISYANTNILYALTGDGDSFIAGGLVSGFGYLRPSLGVFKSFDGGANWQPTGSFGINGTWVGYKLIQHPSNANTLFAATSKGIYRTQNGGSTWEQVLQMDFCHDIEFHPGNPNILYTTGNNSSVKYSTDGGTTWQNPVFDFFPSSAARIEIAVSPANPNYVYLLTGSDLGFRSFYRSVNAGVNFTLQAESSGVPNILGRAEDGDDFDGQVLYDLTVAVSYSDINTLYTGGINIWKSTTGGTSFTNSSHWVNSTPSKYVHADIHHLAINPLNNYLYAATDGGVFRSSDNGVNWIMLSTQLRTSQYYHLAGYPPNETILLGGAQDNGVHRFESSGNVFTEAGGDGFEVIINPGDFNDHYMVVNTSVLTTTNNGATVTEITPPFSGASDFFPALLAKPGNHNTIIAGYRNGTYRSTDAGANWTSLPGVGGGWCLAASTANPSRLYSAGDDNLFSGYGTLKRSDDNGDNWVSITTGLGPRSKITDIFVSENYSGRVWVTSGGYLNGNKVYYSNDAGNTWTNISGTLPNVPVNCIVADAADNVYIGTDIGVFYRGVSHTDWTPFYTGMPNVPVTELVFGPFKIRAATFGRGIWQSSLYNSCASNLTLNANLNGRRFYQASNTIQSAAVLNGGAGTEIIFKGGNFVQLNPGFESLGGNQLKVLVAPCDNGVPSKQNKVADSKENKLR